MNSTNPSEGGTIGSMKGGARKGAGRPATGRTGVLTNFYLSRATVAELRRVPNGQRSKFVEAAIVAALGIEKVI